MSWAVTSGDFLLGMIAVYSFYFVIDNVRDQATQVPPTVSDSVISDAPVFGGITKAEARENDESKEKSGTIDIAPAKPKKDTHTHHIVARNHHLHAEARVILDIHGISINSELNTVELDPSFHYLTYTHLYYNNVNERIVNANSRPGTDDQKRGYVLGELRSMKTMLLAGYTFWLFG